MTRPHDENDPMPLDFGNERRTKLPKALRRLQKQFTYDKQLAAFHQKYNREPATEIELEVFCELYLVGIYNSGRDVI